MCSTRATVYCRRGQSKGGSLSRRGEQSKAPWQSKPWCCAGRFPGTTSTGTSTRQQPRMFPSLVGPSGDTSAVRAPTSLQGPRQGRGCQGIIPSVRGRCNRINDRVRATRAVRTQWLYVTICHSAPGFNTYIYIYECAVDPPACHHGSLLSLLVSSCTTSTSVEHTRV